MLQVIIYHERSQGRNLKQRPRRNAVHSFSLTCSAPFLYNACPPAQEWHYSRWAEPPPHQSLNKKVLPLTGWGPLSHLRFPLPRRLWLMSSDKKLTGKVVPEVTDSAFSAQIHNTSLPFPILDPQSKGGAHSYLTGQSRRKQQRATFGREKTCQTVCSYFILPVDRVKVQFMGLLMSPGLPPFCGNGPFFSTFSVNVPSLHHFPPTTLDQVHSLRNLHTSIAADLFPGELRNYLHLERLGLKKTKTIPGPHTLTQMDTNRRIPWTKGMKPGTPSHRRTR